MCDNIKRKTSKISLALRSSGVYLGLLNIIFLTDTKNKVGLFTFLLCIFIFNTYINYSKLNVMLFIVATSYMIGYLFIF
jgi:uncharacterized membrane protein